MNLKFGRLTVIYYFRKNNYKMVHCICSCGKEKDVYNSNLISGRTKSCGCLEYENRHKFKDLSNQKFGRLMALYPTNERNYGSVVWECRCACGNLVRKNAHVLLKGDVKSCGCLRKKQQDITGKRFGHLIALNALDNKLNWKTLWRCQCKCGNLCNVSFTNLFYNHTKSCGCLRNQEYRTLVDGTILECLKSKIFKNNTSGVKGVYRCRGMWVAYITFQGKRYYLGAYNNLDEVASARKQAEDKFFIPLIKKLST